MSQATEKHAFRAELKQLLHLITHALYSNPEIFLRELISNASDAINRLKFDALSHEHLLEDDKAWKIKLAADPAAGTLTISDNGIGLTRDAAVENLGTIAHSGTKAFLTGLAQNQARPDMIGQFGVGFYSAFMVANKVTVRSRAAGVPPTEAVEWTSDGLGEYTVETITKPRRGTDVVLHLKSEHRQFLDPNRLHAVVKKFSDFLEHPVVMDVEQEDPATKQKVVVEDVLNSRKALWLRSPSEVTPDEYAEFYKQLSGDWEKPAGVLHYTAEGANEFRVLLFLPAQQPMAMRFGGEQKFGPRLYIQRVQIMDHCPELLPEYLRFVVGVVDCSDLPLNISREILQASPVLERIRRELTRSLLRRLEDFKDREYDAYVKFFAEFGAILKEGVARDVSNREKIADLLLFESAATPAGQFTTLEAYTGALSVNQKEILYLTGETRGQLEHSPYLEAARADGRDVLFLTDPIDEWVASSLPAYRGHKLVALDSGTPAAAPQDAAFAPLLAYLKTVLTELADVRLSGRLKESACCLVSEAGGPSAHMERLMRRMGQAEVAVPRILELNAAHPAVVALRDLHAKSAADPRCELFARVLYDQAVLAEGSRLKDPAAFSRRVNDLLVRTAGTA